jgi:hypothetical protein
MVFNMEHNFGYCGLNCSTCEGFIATRDNSDEIRKKLAKEWSNAEYKLKPEDINCLGCHSDQVFTFCDNCGIRICARNKSFKTCAECDDYPCTDKLQANWAHFPGSTAKDNLDSLRK